MNKLALFWKPLKDKTVKCELCPRFCVIKDGERGNCGVRENQKGKLFNLVYGKPASLGLDSIAKKPLHHFCPGEKTLSFGTAGCNLHCMYCQNWSISQCRPEDADSVNMSPKDIVKKTIEERSRIISYTYTEPTIFYEYMLDTAKLAHEKKMKNVMVSNGFINPEPLKKIIPYLDAANIDLKGNEEFYKKYTKSWAEPVLKTLKMLKEKNVWLEITNLLIPGLNDSEKDIKWLVKWIHDNLGDDVPLHLSAFCPDYELKEISGTSIEKLQEVRRMAMDTGLKYVYIGNVPVTEGSATLCPKCRKIVIRRHGFFVEENNIKNNKCSFCGEKIAGVWK